eukprot:811881-Alexandrium_andersonii.AAC.1
MTVRDGPSRYIVNYYVQFLSPTHSPSMMRALRTSHLTDANNSDIAVAIVSGAGSRSNESAASRACRRDNRGPGCWGH